jgi:hypothetical protein
MEIGLDTRCEGLNQWDKNISVFLALDTSALSWLDKWIRA